MYIRQNRHTQIIELFANWDPGGLQNNLNQIKKYFASQISSFVKPISALRQKNDIHWRGKRIKQVAQLYK